MSLENHDERPVITDAAVDDIEDIATLYMNEAVTAHLYDPNNTVLEDDLRAHFAHKVEMLPDRIEDPSQTLLVARLGAQAVGTCALLTESSRLHSMYVATDAQGSGVGSGLVAEVLSRLDDPARANVNVATFNTSARRFYEKMGFSDTGRTTAHWRLASGNTIEEAMFAYRATANSID